MQIVGHHAGQCEASLTRLAVEFEGLKHISDVMRKGGTTCKVQHDTTLIRQILSAPRHQEQQKDQQLVQSEVATQMASRSYEGEGEGICNPNCV